MPLLICKTCHSKDEIWRDARVVGTRFYDGVTYEYEADVKRCGHCGYKRMPAAEKDRVDLLVINALARHGRPGAHGVVALREYLGYSQRDLADLMGIAFRTVQRWETGKNKVRVAAWYVMTCLALDKLAGSDAMAERLRSLAKPAPARVNLADVQT